MKYHLLTLGCQMNKSDSERVSTVLENMGYEPVENEDEANLLGILACSVRQKSIDKVYSKIHKWNKAKNKRPLLTFVSGCVLPADREKFLKLFDLVFQMAELPDLPDMIRQYGVNTGVGWQYEKSDSSRPVKVSMDETVKQSLKGNLLAPTAIKPFWSIQPQYQSEYEAYIPIQNGCDKFCTFCAVPYTRGREISRPSAEIVAEFENLIDNGYKIITLLGQNVNSYGKDKNGNEISFAQLLEEIGKAGMRKQSNAWVYFTSPHPRDMTNDVVDVMAKYPVLAKQVHLPLQSGDDKVLIRMNRNHNVARYREIVQYIRERLPEATLFTDIIVGFTGETEQQFQNTVEAMNEFKFNMAYIAKYSPRPGATSFKWEDDIPNDTKKQRLHELTVHLKKHTASYNQTMQNQKVRVIITGYNKDKKCLSALTEGKINIRVLADEPEWVGTFREVEVTGGTNFSLEGQPVQKSVATLA